MRRGRIAFSVVMGALAIFMFAHAMAGYAFCSSCDQDLIHAVYWAGFAACVGFAWLPWVIKDS